MKPTTPLHRFRQVYSHDHRIAVLLELAVNSEFTARTDEFRRLALDLAMQIAATNPPDVAALLAQPTIRDPVVTVLERLAGLASDLQERIVVTRFVRWGE